MSVWAQIGADFRFLRPLWLLALLAVPLIVLLWRRLLATRDPWRSVVDPHLLAALREPGAARGARGLLAVILLLLVLAVLALAGPAWQRLPQPLLRAESALIIALDLSDRMRAADVAPSRLARAKFKIADLLRARGDGQVALIAYAGDAFTVAPLTDDGGTLLSLLSSLDHETLPEQGQRADRAIRQAAKLLANAGFTQGDLLLVTDRSDARDQRAAREAAAAGLRVSVLGVGSSAGAPVAQPGGGFLRDASGGILLPRRDEDALRALATAGGGTYQPLAVDLADLRALGLLDPTAGVFVLREEQATIEQFQDEGIWLLLLLLPLAALTFRRGWLACVPLVLLLTPPPAAAWDLGSLWQRDDQRAWQALQDDQHEAARALAQDPALRGSAAYRAGDFAAAAEDFAQSATADGHYNRGNALARAGQLQEALQAYDQALAQQPEMDDARTNRDIVEEEIKRQPPPPEGQNGAPDDQQHSDDQEPGEQQEGEKSSEENQEGAGQPPPQPGDPDGQPGAEQRPETQDDGGDQDDSQSAEQPDADAQQQFADEMEQALEQQPEDSQQSEVRMPTPEETQASEQRQANEQLLRRVPDDPGGLLRRKFAIEARRRERDGQENE